MLQIMLELMLLLSIKLIFVLLSLHKLELKSLFFFFLKEERHNHIIYRWCTGPGQFNSAGNFPTPARRFLWLEIRALLKSSLGKKQKGSEILISGS